jgi:hypothetical protein
MPVQKGIQGSLVLLIISMGEFLFLLGVNFSNLSGQGKSPQREAKPPNLFLIYLIFNVILFYY